MGKGNGAAEPVDEDDHNFDWKAPMSLEVLRALIAASRGRQGKPAQLTPDEQRLTRDECELLLNRERQAEYEAAKITQAMFSACISLFSFAIGGGLFLLSYTNGLPGRLTKVIASSEGRIMLVGVAGMGFAVMVYSIVQISTSRPGTDGSDSKLLIWILLAFGAVSIGAIAALTWFPSEALYVSLAMVVFGIVLVIPIITMAYLWLEQRAKVSLLTFAVLVLAASLVVYVGWSLLFLWRFVQEASLWSTGLIVTFKIGVATILILGIVRSLRRLRALLAERRAGAG